jgi:uncharacterized coiled-coil protein SlyX
MDTQTFPYRLLRASLLAGSVAFALPIAQSGAETLQVPWECSNYEGDAQTRCVNALIEAQQKKIAELEGKVQAQQSTVGQLKDQIDRQANATADLQRQLTERQVTSVVPFSYPYPYNNPYAYNYAYPPGFGLGLGFGLNFGNSGIYASPFYRPFWGHRHYGYWGHRW